MENESPPQKDSAPSDVNDASLAPAGSSQTGEDGISGSGASAPKDANENTGGTPGPQKLLLLQQQRQVRLFNQLTLQGEPCQHLV